MKKISYIVLILLLSVVACSNDETTGGNCFPIIDTNLQTLDANCRAAADEEHIRLDNVTVEGSGEIYLYAKAASASGTSGIEIKIDSTNIVYTNLDDTPATNTFTQAHGGLSGTTLCFDLHYEEAPIHAIAWKGSECDSTKSGAGNEGTVIYNKEPGDAVTGNETEASTVYAYRMTNVSAAAIKTSTPIFSE